MYTHLTSEVEKYILSLPQDDREKLIDMIKELALKNGKLNSGHTKYLRDKIWELRLDSGKRQHRLLFTIVQESMIVMLSAFTKKTRKTPHKIIERATKLRSLILKELNEK
ncbi:MAG: type II toxin-antitoxin system RelE/ParE family toxin [bacterium]|nr:type II toxin-antitoxin system RelE/ParE family toxin [bacterium]